ncbi:MAG: Do family serine endopeptidase [Acidobacteriota bacterium]
MTFPNDSTNRQKGHSRKPWLAGITLIAVGAVGGAWVTAQTGHFPFSYSSIQASAAGNEEAPDISFKTGFAPIVKRVTPAVVTIESTQNAKKVVSRNGGRNRGGQGQGQGQMQIPDELRQFFGNGGGNLFDDNGDGNQTQPKRQGVGSGVITTADGYIITNNHVVDGADEVKVVLSDKREFTAKVIGKDPQSDVAVVKIDAANLPHVQFGNSDNVEVGDIVLAMGNPFNVGQTVTMGIVGATGRHSQRIEEYEDFIQTDAAINPGNSGGALVNLKGELIGMNTAILTNGGGGNQGVGFAIPVNMVRNVMDQIVHEGKVSRGFMGVLIQPVTPEIAKQFHQTGEPRGVMLSEVNAGGPAERAGLKQGDIVMEINGSKVRDTDDLRLRIANLKPNSSVKLTVLRDGANRDFTVQLGSQPGEKVVSENRSSSAEPDGSPRLGVSLEPVTPEIARQFNLKNQSGLVITDVQEGSAAAEAGLKQGDVIQEVNRTPVKDTSEFKRIVSNSKEPLLLYVRRDGNGTYITVKPQG